MKNIIVLIFALLLTSCQGQEKKENNTNSKKENNMVETLNIDQIEKEAEKYPITNTEYSYELKKEFDNGASYKITGSVYENGFVKYEIPPKPSFLTVYKEFYANGNLKKKETYIGEHVKVGISRYYDDRGNLLKEVNEDQKFGKIKPQQVLEFLQEKGYIDLKTGKGRVDEDGNPVFNLYFGEDKKEKYWIISIVKGIPNNDPANFPDIGEPPAFLPLDYIMDGETGKVTEEDSHTNKDKKETSAIYKTYKGRNYTEEQWKVFEQELFEIYARKHNIPLTKNDTEKNTGRVPTKSTYMLGEVISEKKEKTSGKKDKKETPAVYKTYKGKNYTEEQWKVFEQELFEIYARKHNIPLAKNDKKNSSGRTFLSLFEDEDTKKDKNSGFKFLGDD